jgi:ElaB/YqjD/DUF883 family membrane-anchored ribosome-binding protein
MGMDNEDRAFIQSQFDSIRNELNSKSGELHKRINDSRDSQVKQYKDLTDDQNHRIDKLRQDVQAMNDKTAKHAEEVVEKHERVHHSETCEKIVTDALAKHEDVHHAVGWPKVVTMIGTISALVIGIAAFLKAESTAQPKEKAQPRGEERRER